MIRGLINVLQQTDNDCSNSNVSTFHTQFGAQTCFAKFTSKFQTLPESRRLSLSEENKPKDSREALADEMFQKVQQSYLLHCWRKWLPVSDAQWVHSFNWVFHRENRTDTSDKRLLTSSVNFAYGLITLQLFIWKNREALAGLSAVSSLLLCCGLFSFPILRKEKLECDKEWFVACWL